MAALFISTDKNARTITEESVVKPLSEVFKSLYPSRDVYASRIDRTTAERTLVTTLAETLYMRMVTK